MIDRYGFPCLVGRSLQFQSAFLVLRYVEVTLKVPVPQIQGYLPKPRIALPRAETLTIVLWGTLDGSGEVLAGSHRASLRSCRISETVYTTAFCFFVFCVGVWAVALGHTLGFPSVFGVLCSPPFGERRVHGAASLGHAY